MSGCKVYLIKAGSLVRDQEGCILDARSTVTLITSDIRVVVDTGMAGEDGIILSSLAGIGLKPEDIDAVVNTHSHPDHTGNNHLFTQAQILDHRSLWDGCEVAEGVVVIETPGHSPDSICLLCRSGAMIAIAGDAIPIRDNFSKWVPPRLHTDREEAMRSMKRIVALSAVVVPGHDRPFRVRDGEYLNSGPDFP
ncbi:MAG TPA: MBL fold metallo-hydrolase [Methanotrichaceae archaeon]|nr:MBL fold metallo-hydrolase [Methanotrichaceae archaeon]HQF15589.1 MBL fold metallo-hydrolase [Methanotrichaceae archaeon]HQI90325.1 MBL fold metallo-hydrolase [Methanotrichaceae archaeon]HQJ28568.1 MBL fold metallo-hydrolase [Methanotrichaceae archaeon]